MKRLLLFISTLLCANVLMAQTTFWIDSLQYEVISTNPAEVKVNDANDLITTAIIPETVSYEGTNYSVTSIGDAAFFYCSSLTSVTIPNGVTSIGNVAFRGCSSLTSIDIPNSVTSIGDYAFTDCSSLTSIDIPNSVTYIGREAFSGCSSLTSIDIPNSVTSIGNRAFQSCSSLTSITIPNSVTSIGDHAFRRCSSLTSVIIGNSVTSIGGYTFFDCSSLTSVSIPNSVTSIGEYAFYVCLSLTSIDIPNSVTSIGERAFYCRNLTSVTCLAETAPSLGSSVFYNTSTNKTLTVPCESDYSAWEIATTWASVERIVDVFTIGDLTYEKTSATEVSVKDCDLTATEVIIPASVEQCGITYSVTSIGDSAFWFCSSLTSIDIPNSVTSIGGYAFVGCRSLTSIDIPNSVTSIGDWAFSSCSSLTSIDIPNGVTSIGNSAFDYCSSLTSVTIPNSATSIGEAAFGNCSSLTSIDIPNSVTAIGNVAFAYCSSLTSITIPNSVTSIGYGAFQLCSSLTSIDIPNSVTSIGYWAFSHCSNLTSVTCLAETAPSLGADVFYSTPSTKTLTYTCGATGYSTNWGNTTWASVNEDCPALEIGEQFTIGDFTYEVTSANEVAVKTYNNNTATSTEIPSTVTYQGTTYTVTFIAGKAFYNKDNLTSVTIPNTVTAIGTSTDTYGAFEECDGLTSISIPNSVTSIGDYAFYTCSSLTSVTISNNVTSIGEWAFRHCSSLTSVTIGNSVTSIGAHAFAGCISLTSITIPNSVTSIGGSAFSDCSSLTSVTIGNSVTFIGYSAFSHCSSLTSVAIPNSVTSIGDEAFYRCSSLTSVILPNNANYISSDAFKNTGGINVGGIYYGGKGTVNIGNYTFNNVGFIKFYLNGNATTITPSEVSVIDCDESLSGDIVIPSILSYEGINIAVTFIAGKAFYNKDNLTSVTIPNTVTAIGTSTDTYGAFEECDGLTSISIPNSVTSIGRYTFYSCRSLTSVTIGNSVTTIGDRAFIYCSSLDSVTCLAETAPSLVGADVFYSTPSTKVLNIPFGSDYSSWQGDTDWSKTNYLIQEGETKELANDFTINSTTGLINQGVLRIKQSGQLINETETNVSGIFEVETPTLANDKWSFIGAPFNNYKLEAVKPGTKDISISLFDYTTGNWSNDFATIEDEVGAGEGFFAWSFAAEPTVFTTYGDGAEEYNFENTPEYALNNGAVTVTKNLTTHEEGGNWLALSNPYTFKLDVNKFLSEQSNIKGGVVYRFNGETWDDVQAGVINMTEGFFVNYETEDAHSVSFSKSHRYDGAKKAETKKDYMKLLLNDGERTTRLLFAQNDKAKQGDDLFDANKLFSPLEITEPYFVTDGVALVKEEVNALPYTANLNIRNYETKEVTISIDNIPEGVTVFLLDNGQDIKMNGGVEYTTTITEGENADRFQLLVKKQQRIERNTNNQITIKNNNRQITITSDITNLNIEVYNNLGQKVFATKDYNFTLDQLPSGSYVVKAFYGRVNQSQKIVIE